MRWLIAGLLVLITPTSSYAGSQSGGISYYWQGTKTASGERFHPGGISCAHKTLRFGTMVTVHYRGRSVTCRVNDRGPFIRGRILDLSRGAAQAIGMTGAGVIHGTITW